MTAPANLISFTDVMSRRRRRKAIEFFHIAYHAQMKGNYCRAIEFYQRSLRISPTPEAYTFLGWTYSFLGELESAISECRKAIELDPDFGNPYNDIGAYLIAQGRHKDAMPYLRQALDAKRYRALHFAHFNLGRVCEHEGDMLNAYRHYRLSVSLEPRYLIAQSAIERIKRSLMATCAAS